MEEGARDSATGADAEQTTPPGSPALNLRVHLALLLPGLVPAAVLAFIASFTICGISGCSGGGFGRSTDPNTTLALLVLAGLVAAAPLAIYALWGRDLRTALLASFVAVIVSVTAGWLIGSDFRGCPRNVDTATCMEESS
jgi:hypothetical protein